DSFHKKEEEDSDGSYKKPVDSNGTATSQPEQTTSKPLETTPLEEFFLPEPPVIQGQGVNTGFDTRAANYGKEGNYCTELSYQTLEQLGMYDTDWSAMDPDEAQELQKEMNSVALSVFAEFFEREVAALIEKGVHSCSPDGRMFDKDGNEIKSKQLSNEAYDAQVAEKMFDVLDFLKETNPKCYDLMVAWREDNGISNERDSSSEKNDVVVQSKTTDTSNSTNTTGTTENEPAIDPTDPTNPSTYEPDAWLKDYYTQISTETGEEVVDKTDPTNPETYDPKAWLTAYRASKTETPKVEETPEVEESPEVEENEDSQGETEETPSSASDFATKEEYFDYLKETYTGIERDNLDIPDTLLEQAMNDPKKEEELLAFLDKVAK
ncbi:MAG: hypothetical protein R3Y63_14965, partial [Eubacteriales bacterium]